MILVAEKHAAKCRLFDFCYRVKNKAFINPITLSQQMPLSLVATFILTFKLMMSIKVVANNDLTGTTIHWYQIGTCRNT